MKVFILVNSKNEWLCSNFSKYYFSTKDIRNMNTYKFISNAEKRLQDIEFWEYHKIDNSDLRIVIVELKFTEIDNAKV